MTTPATVAIASGKGGVGKTMISVDLALELAAGGRKIGLLDADMYGPDVLALLGLTRRRPARTISLFEARRPRRYAPLDVQGLKVFSLQMMIGEDQAFAVQGAFASTLLTRMYEQVEWGDVEVIVVDLPPGTADVQQTATGLRLLGALVVVTPAEVAHLDARKLLGFLRRTGVDVIGGIENMAGLTCGDCGGNVELFERVADDRSIWSDGVEKLASLPFRAGESFRRHAPTAPGPLAGVAERIRQLLDA